jgi:hypothetical protein
MTIRCVVCRQSFVPRRSTARFCGPRCRQAAHRSASRSPVDGLGAKRSEPNVRSTRYPPGSAAGAKTPPPLPGVSTAAAQRPELAPASFTSSSPFRLLPDEHWNGMWRILPGWPTVGHAQPCQGGAHGTTRPRRLSLTLQAECLAPRPPEWTGQIRLRSFPRDRRGSTRFMRNLRIKSRVAPDPGCLVAGGMRLSD